MSGNLEILAQNREAILLAEVVGWLHDYRKCSEEHLQTQAANQKGQALPRSELGKQYPSLKNVLISLPDLSAPRNFVELLDDKTWNNDLLGQFLSRCHNTAHFDKHKACEWKAGLSWHSDKFSLRIRVFTPISANEPAVEIALEQN